MKQYTELSKRKGGTLAVKTKWVLCVVCKYVCMSCLVHQEGKKMLNQTPSSTASNQPNDNCHHAAVRLCQAWWQLQQFFIKTLIASSLFTPCTQPAPGGLFLTWCSYQHKPTQRWYTKQCQPSTAPSRVVSSRPCRPCTWPKPSYLSGEKQQRSRKQSWDQVFSGVQHAERNNNRTQYLVKQKNK